ncbi:MAG: NADH-quinone oxidoreductase subunit M [Sphingobacteriaceae bacterium]|nr:NADH-quinone oxidoreductase subunit M [Sphingobacteriaceae bacterium]
MLAGSLIIFPLIAALLVFMAKGKGARNLALGFSILQFALSLVALFQFKHNPASQHLLLNCTWVKSLGINFAVGLDGFAILLVLLTTFLVPLIIVTSFKNTYERENIFYGLILLMQMALVGVFMANDGFLFYVFWELALIPIYFICLMWGGENRGKITFKFFVYTLLGSLFMLVGLVYLYNHSSSLAGTKSWAIQDLINSGRSLAEGQQSIIFWLIFIAFAIKMPIFPFHTWQPDTYVTAPTQGTMLLSGIMAKMGTFGVMKWLLPIVPLGIEKWGGVAIGLSIAGVIYGSCIAIVQKDYKRLIAYSSFAHLGLIGAGILTATAQGLQGAMLQMVAHGINAVGLFLIADILLPHTGTRDVDKLGGIRSMNGNFAVLFLIVMLGAVALPLTSGFPGEFLLINGVFQFSATAAAFAGLSVILGAVYMLRSYQAIMLGERKDSHNAFGPLDGSDKAVLIIICAAIIAFGIYPKAITDIAEPAVKALMQNLK